MESAGNAMLTAAVRVSGSSHSRRDPGRSTSSWRIIRLAKLALYMDVRNAVDEGKTTLSRFGMRKRGLRPDRRLPRYLRRKAKAPAISEAEISADLHYPASQPRPRRRADVQRLSVR